MAFYSFQYFSVGLGRILFWQNTGYLYIRLTNYASINLVSVEYQISSWISDTAEAKIFLYCNMSKRLYVCLSVRPSICIMYELLLIYCYSTKNLRNYAFVSLFIGIFVVKYKILNCRIYYPAA